jgi:hypothetical protein
MKKLLLVLAFVSIYRVALAQSNLTCYTFSLTVATNISEMDVARYQKWFEQHEEGLVGGSVGKILSLSQDRLNDLIQDRMIKDLDFVDLDISDVNDRLNSVAGKSFEYGTMDWVSKNDLFIYVNTKAHDLFSGSINVNEELLDPTATYHQHIEDVWWKHLAKGRPNIGIRLRYSSYVFASKKITKDGKTVAQAHMRYYFHDRLTSDQKVEFILNKPLLRDWSITTGVAYLTNPNSHQEKTVGVIRLDRKHFSLAFRPGDSHFVQGNFFWEF